MKKLILILCGLIFTPPAFSSGDIKNVQKVFPTGIYKLVASGRSKAEECPPSGKFIWNSEGRAGWVFRMSATFNLSLPKNALASGGPQPGRYNSPKSPCQVFSTYSWDSQKKKMSMREDFRCVQKKLERSFFMTMQRRDNRLTLSQNQTKGLELKDGKAQQLLKCNYLLQI